MRELLVDISLFRRLNGVRRRAQHQVAHSISSARSIQDPVAVPSQALRAFSGQNEHHTADARYALAVV